MHSHTAYMLSYSITTVNARQVLSSNQNTANSQVFFIKQRRASQRPQQKNPRRTRGFSYFLESGLLDAAEQIAHVGGAV